ncbi:hypothetical protein H8356DRAFT_184803 [Neocallimastix lanati (nom. inval.)]|nr:hypothetical protein H8356DRAFT_184803 [Neocallimastix sp. JGI-2020a]
MKSYNNILNDENNNIMNITGKFGMETSINNFSTIIKTDLLEDISFIKNNDKDQNLLDEKIINENQEKYTNYIKEFKFYFNKNDKENALNSLLKANKLNSNDLNLHWWILKLIIDLKMIE